jgi:hypothetical protein
MFDPAKRFSTIVLAAGSAVLLIAIAIGERMGDRVLGDAAQQQLQSTPVVTVSPSAMPTSGAFGPDWKRSETLSAANDPRFPDPRVPPQPLPTPLPTPKPTPTPKPVPATPTPNPNIPIWRQKPLPTWSPTIAPVESPSPEPSVSPMSLLDTPDMIGTWKMPERLP